MEVIVVLIIFIVLLGLCSSGSSSGGGGCYVNRKRPDFHRPNIKPGAQGIPFERSKK